MNKVVSNDKAGNRTESEPVFTQEREPFGPAEMRAEAARVRESNPKQAAMFERFATHAEAAKANEGEHRDDVQELVDRMDRYGVSYEGEVVTERYHSEVSDRWMTLAEVSAEGGKISRLRMLAEWIPGRGRCVDISYIHATLPSGQIVHVHEDLSQGYLIRVRDLKKTLVEWAKEHEVFAKGLGLLDESNWSTLG